MSGFPVKIVAVGDGCVGKTCLLISYSTNKFPTEYVPTIFENYAAVVKVDNQLINLGLWDTAGQQAYEKLRVLAYTHCDVFFIVFSVIQPSSFQNACKQWLPELNTVSPESLKIFIGNKIDLRQQYSRKKLAPKDAPVVQQTARKIIQQQYKCRYFECSALTQQGLKFAFEEAIRQVVKSKRTQTKKTSKNDCQLI